VAQEEAPAGGRVHGLRIEDRRLPLDVLFDAFVDDRTGTGWLVDGAMSVRGSQPGKVARFDWAGGESRVMVTFEGKGPGRATAHVAHERLPDAAAGEAAKVAWRARLAELKSSLEAPAKSG
jgi:hypothetical protein